MLTIWKGKGWIVPVIFIAAFMDIQLVVDYFMGEGFYSVNRWVKIVSLVVVSVLIGCVGLVLNHSKRSFSRDEATGEVVKVPTHTLLFLPIEVWAVIVPFIFLSLDYFSTEQKNKTLSYLETPKINDIYSVDFSKIFTNEDPVYKYGTMLVVAVNSKQIEIQSSVYAYDGKSGVRKDIHNGRARDITYYTAEISPFTIQQIIDYYQQGVIFSVHRDPRLQ